jgi:hypothetical protein
MFQRVRVSVEERTNRAQTPWESTSLRGDFYFLAASSAAVRVDAPRPSGAPDPQAEERVAAIPKEGTEAKFRSITLRDKPDLNFYTADLQKMIKDRNFFHRSYNLSGDFPNDFVDNGDGTVTDRVTGLMWQKRGSPSEVAFGGASEYVKALKAERFAGYTNWRLPTVEELCSLLEPIQNNRGLHIDTVFSETSYAYWSCDQVTRYGGALTAYVVYFGNGDVGASDIDIGYVGGGAGMQRHFVKAVRTMK